MGRKSELYRPRSQDLVPEPIRHHTDRACHRQRRNLGNLMPEIVCHISAFRRLDVRNGSPELQVAWLSPKDGEYMHKDARWRWVQATDHAFLASLRYSQCVRPFILHLK